MAVAVLAGVLAGCTQQQEEQKDQGTAPTQDQQKTEEPSS